MKKNLNEQETILVSSDVTAMLNKSKNLICDSIKKFIDIDDLGSLDFEDDETKMVVDCLGLMMDAINASIKMSNQLDQMNLRLEKIESIQKDVSDMKSELAKKPATKKAES